MALTTDSSILTCIGNDSSFENIFSRQVAALAVNGDIIVGISTSGRSANVLKALEDTARLQGAITVGLTDEKDCNNVEANCDCCLVVPSANTARIQESHLFIWHTICNIVENQIF